VTTTCPACGHDSETDYRCDECGRDLVDVDDGRRDGPLRTDGGEPMQKLTVRVPTEQLSWIDSRVEEGGWPSRSAAIRQAIRELARNRRELGRPDHVSDVRTDGGVGRAARERRRRAEVRDQERDRRADQGPCPHVDVDDPLPCLDCLVDGGDE
jgi:Arc/MetJ-type ribon-helix-helix transcriptional regulator